MTEPIRALRALVAMLARDAGRAAVVAAVDTGAQADAGALRGLVATGVAAEHDGVVRLRPGFAADALAAIDAATGPLAALRGEPIAMADVPRSDVDLAVALAARRVVAQGETLDERTLTDRLALFVRDPAFVRRHAVDTGVLDRAADGSSYRLAGAAG